MSFSVVLDCGITFHWIHECSYLFAFVLLWRLSVCLFVQSWILVYLFLSGWLCSYPALLSLQRCVRPPSWFSSVLRLFGWWSQLVLNRLSNFSEQSTYGKFCVLFLKVSFQKLDRQSLRKLEYLKKNVREEIVVSISMCRPQVSSSWRHFREVHISLQSIILSCSSYLLIMVALWTGVCLPGYERFHVGNQRHG